MPKCNGGCLNFLRRTRNLLVTQSGIRSGNIELLQKAKESEPYRIVLETRLDADDGLHLNFIEHVQNDALHKFGSLKASLSPLDALKDLQEPNHLDSYKWYYWCTESHLKWYPHGNGECGQLHGEKRSNFCVTPGLTIGFNVGTLVKHVPQYGHPSAGMADIQIVKEKNDGRSQQDLLWDVLRKSFGILNNTVTETN
jgi:Protein of unknown function (DUF3118).